MLYYRLYFMSARTGRIMRFAEYEAPDDTSALALAREQEGEHALELWCRHRRVGRFEPSDPASRIVASRQLARERQTQSAESEA